MRHSRILGLVALGAGLACGAIRAAEPPSHLKVAVVQLALTDTIAGNRDRIVERTAEAAALGARVVVFPEGAVRGRGDDDQAVVDEALAAIRRAAQRSNVYVLVGGKTWSPVVKQVANWMYVIGPDGRDRFRYEKLYNNHRAKMPDVFEIDGVPCNAMICADRWLRGVEEIPIQQGAVVSFEMSNNYSPEWVPPLEWYWTVPRALRNDVWVVLANSCSREGIVSHPPQTNHGHSAIIAPDGRLVASSPDNTETILVAELDVGRATRAAALARRSHPALRPYWEAGIRVQRGESIDAPPLQPLKSSGARITIAAAQTAGDLPAMLSMIGAAREKGADLVAFPARAIDESALPDLQIAAREHGLVVVVGMEHRTPEGRRNSAFVIGPDGSLLTRYDQLSAGEGFQPGDDPQAMWFRVKGLPAIVTIGQDALWTELAELAAVAGARVQVHLDHDPADGPEASLRRLQIWSNFVSYHTLSATVNVAGSALWEDLRDSDERRAEVKGTPRPDAGGLEIYSPFSSNVVVSAATGPQLLTATRDVGPVNTHHPKRTINMNPQMDPWYRFGAALVRPQW